MGYDFTFFRLPADPGVFPFRPTGDYSPPMPKFTDLNPIGDLLISRMNFRTSGPRGAQEHHYWWDTDDGGSLNVSLGEESINVDTHAHWRFVLTLYDCIRELYPDLVIADLQTGELHNADSFAAFVRGSYEARESDQ